MPRVRECIKNMQGYVPGAPARDESSIKLNQNENRYPPSPAVLAAVEKAAKKAALYPESSSYALRQKAADLYGVKPEEVMAANGSDEMLRILFQAFCDPGDEVVAFYPSYTYYATLGAMQNVHYRLIDFDDDFQLPESIEVGKAKLLLLPNPNAPTGVLFSEKKIRNILASAPDCLVVIDEAYIDFATPGSTVIPLLKEYGNLAVTRTFSKSYALAGLRVGLGFAREETLFELEKVRDYYNVDRLAQAAAEAALDDQAWLKETTGKIIAAREKTRQALLSLGVKTYPSQANFLLVDCGNPEEAARIFTGLEKHNILVRYFNSRRIDSCLRISIGADKDIEALVEKFAELL